MELIRKFAEEIQLDAVLLTGMRIVLILVLLKIALSAIGLGLRRLELALITKGQAEGEVPSESAKRAETLVRLLRQGVVILVWAMAILVILRELGVEIAPILASAGIVGLAVGFGAQNLVRDVISGFFMIMENQVRVGDVAVINGQGGLVESVNFRTVMLRDLAGTVHIFPNGTVTTIANMTTEWSAYVFDIGVAYKEDTDRVIEVMRAVGEELKADPACANLILEDIEIMGVDDFADSAVIIKGRIKTVPIKQWQVGREYRRRLKKAFDREGIEIPFPHRSIYFGEQNPPAFGQLLAKADGQKPS